MSTTFSDLLNAVRSNKADCALIELGAPGGVQFLRARQAYFHIILNGTVHLEGPGLPDPVELTAGDYAIVLGGNTHSIRESLNSSLVGVKYFQEDHDLDIPPMLRFGGNGSITKFLTGTFELDRNTGNSIVRGLPSVLIGKQTNSEGASPSFKLDPKCVENSCYAPGASAFLSCVADILFIQAVRSSASLMLPEGKPMGEILGTPQISTALRLINARPETDWSLNMLASEVGMSRSVFAAAFRLNVGETPMQYVTGVRVARAAELLKSHAMAVPEVARRVGYNSESSFARAFKKRYSMTPGTYRRSKRGTSHRSRPANVHWDPFLS
jgi:AraC-like DNA-binding protein